MQDEVCTVIYPITKQKLNYNKELQAATASEPLELDAEYDMQRSWRLDHDKLTFIACLRPDKGRNGEKEDLATISGEKDDVASRMIGDVNLFLCEDDEEDDDAVQGRLIGEVEIMIARKDLQGKGLGSAVLRAFLWYIITNLNAILSEYEISGAKDAKGSLRYFRVKIDAKNDRSIKLFEKAGFKLVSDKPNYFGELELRLGPDKGVYSYDIDKETPTLAVYKLNSNGPKES
jgi:RimJ/RimL family protein N-acetyltransferase